MAAVCFNNVTEKKIEIHNLYQAHVNFIVQTVVKVQRACLNRLFEIISNKLVILNRFIQ